MIALSFKEFGEFVFQVGSSESVVVLAAFIALGISKGRITRGHLADGTPATFCHAFLIGGYTRQHLTSLFVTCSFTYAIGLEAPMLDDVVKHGCPFGWSKFSVQPFRTQFPRGNCRFQCIGGAAEKESFALEQAAQAQQAKCATANSATCQSGITPNLVERFTFLGSFCLVESAYMQGENVIFCQQRRTDRCHADVQAQDVIMKWLQFLRLHFFSLAIIVYPL